MLGGGDRVWGTGRPAQRLLGELGARPDRLANLPYFIELDHYRSGPRTAEGPVQLGSASQLVDRKDLKTALRALASLHDRGISNWRYRIVGTGPAEEGLRQEAAALGIADRVELVGWLEGDALVEFFATCDVFVHPCEFEPWGVVIMEAMASGAAIVASDRTYCALDWVEPEVSGLIHRTWDADDLAKKLEWILADRGRIGRMGEAAREVVRRWPVSRGVEEIEARAGA